MGAWGQCLRSWVPDGPRSSGVPQDILGTIVPKNHSWRIAPAVLAVGLAAPAAASGGPADPDRAELLKIQQAYERAVTENKPELILPYIDEGFQGETLFIPVQGRDGFQALWDKTRRDIGKGRGVSDYKLRIKPEKLDVKGPSAVASGRTEEEIETPMGRIRYSSRWNARLEKRDGRWRLTGMTSRFNPADTVAVAVGGLLKTAWLKRLSLRAPRAGAPDFDRDGYRSYIK